MVCQNCKQQYQPNPLFLTRFNFPLQTIFYKGQGCEQCHSTGYRGRMGIFSVLTFTDELRTMIIEQKPLDELQDRAVALGMKTLVQDAEVKILAGLTTVEEAIKVV
jgi:type II secretory ATPase GspE/PulE/Tfp pilus assembly ATPase PilB-like protein